MAGRCAMLNCKNSRRKGFRTFRFPRDKDRRAKWEALCRRKDFKATDNSEMCEEHFTEDQFENNRQDGRRPLKWYAVPDKWVKEQAAAEKKPASEKNENTHTMLINLEKLITPASSASNVEITPKVLPKQYRNAIVSSTAKETVVKSSISSTSDIDDWVKTFGINTGTRWNVRKSKPEVSCIRILCGKDYVCQHSAYHKAITNDHNMHKKGISKSTNCEARIIIRIRRSSSYMRQKDSHIKEGLLGTITIRNEHNHAFPSMISLKQLMAAENVRDIFFEYFNKHINPTKDCKLQLTAGGFESGLDPNNTQINILRQTIMHWFNIWKWDKNELKESNPEEETLLENENLSQINFEPWISTTSSVVTVTPTGMCGIENIILDDEKEIILGDVDEDYQHVEEDFQQLEEDFKPNNDEYDDIKCLISEEEMDEEESSDTTDLFNDVIDRLKQLHHEYGSSSIALRSLKENLDRITTREEWSTFLLTI